MYAQYISKPRGESAVLYEDSLPRNRKYRILSDLNARVGNTVIPSVMNRSMRTTSIVNISLIFAPTMNF